MHSILQRKIWLEQYYQIRQDCFRKELGLRSFDGSEDEFDRSGYLLLALDQDRCIGGVRLSISTPQSPTRLPLEINGFTVPEIFPEIIGNGESYSQWTRLALLPEYRTAEVLRVMALTVLRQAEQLDCSYAFNVAGMNRARLYQRLHRTQGFNYEILQDVKIPAESHFMGLEHLLSVGYLKPQVSQQLLSRHLSNRTAVNAYSDRRGIAVGGPQRLEGMRQLAY
ncbi:MAG: hypothetical protein V7752_15645 [Halopseudomonas sp.]